MKYLLYIFVIIILSNCKNKTSWSDKLAYQKLNEYFSTTKDYGIVDENRFNCILNNQIWNNNIKFFFYDNMEYNGLFIYKINNDYKIYKSELNDIYSNDLLYTMPPKFYYELKSIGLSEEEINRIIYLSSFFRERVFHFTYERASYISSTKYLKSLNNTLNEFSELLNDTVKYIFNEIDTPIINCDNITKNYTWTIDSIPKSMLTAKIKELNNIKRFIQNEYNIDSLAKIENNNLYYTIPELEIINFERIKQNDSITIQMTKVNKYDYEYREKSWLIAPLWEYK